MARRVVVNLDAGQPGRSVTQDDLLKLEAIQLVFLQSCADDGPDGKFTQIVHIMACIRPQLTNDLKSER